GRTADALGPVGRRAAARVRALPDTRMHGARSAVRRRRVDSGNGRTPGAVVHSPTPRAPGARDVRQNVREGAAMRFRAGGWVVVLVSGAPVAHAQSLAEVFKKVSDSVVVIHATERAAPDRPGMIGSDEAEIGSGVLIDTDKVLTAAHVVQIAERVVVDVA